MRATDAMEESFADKKSVGLGCKAIPGFEDEALGAYSPYFVDFVFFEAGEGDGGV